jgi:hypothetical protein
VSSASQAGESFPQRRRSALCAWCCGCPRRPTDRPDLRKRWRFSSFLALLVIWPELVLTNDRFFIVVLWNRQLTGWCAPVLNVARIALSSPFEPGLDCERPSSRGCSSPDQKLSLLGLVGLVRHAYKLPILVHCPRHAAACNQDSLMHKASRHFLHFTADADGPVVAVTQLFPHES